MLVYRNSLWAQIPEGKKDKFIIAVQHFIFIVRISR